MRRPLIGLAAAGGLLGAAVLSTCFPTKPAPIKFAFQRSLQAGSTDPSGATINGTEIMSLVAHQGRLYAATSVLQEADPKVKKSCQILVLDSKEGQWRVDYECPLDHLRVTSMQSVTFTTDNQGHIITPVTLLIAAPDVPEGEYQVLTRDDEAAIWVPVTLGQVVKEETRQADGFHPGTSRAMGFHLDRVTGVDRVFVGVSVLGLFSGAYDPNVPGRILWDKAPEMPTPALSRMMAYTECNGELFVLTSRDIFRRKDGAKPTWESIYHSAKDTYFGGMRGLTAVPNPDGPRQALLFYSQSKIRRLDPSRGFKETIELELTPLFTELNHVKVDSVWAAPNEFAAFSIPKTHETAWLVGAVPEFSPRVAKDNPQLHLVRYAAKNKREHFRWRQARYLVRRISGNEIRYEAGELDDAKQPLLVALRTVVPSPFLGDEGKALYLGGFDVNINRFHHTAWIYRAEY